MINEDSISNYNTRLTVDYTKMKDLTPAQKDRVRNYGSQAENLMKNRDLAMFIHHHKFDIADQLAGIRGHSPEDNALRIALSNELTGIDNFINSLKRAVYLKSKVGNSEIEPGNN
jgi:hypothetical protein